MRPKKTAYKNATDEKLMELLVKGNMGVFDELYSRYKDRLFYYFYRMLGNSKEKAEDFLQELFYKVIDKQASFDTCRNFPTWLFSIAHNMCKNEYRSCETRSVVSLSEEMDTYEGHFLQDNVDLKAFKAQLFKELDTMDPVRKSAFLLRYREGFKVAEISAILETSEGTIKSGMHYTVKSLSQRLKKFRKLLQTYCLL